jgi:hypothetical protein
MLLLELDVSEGLCLVGVVSGTMASLTRLRIQIVPSGTGSFSCGWQITGNCDVESKKSVCSASDVGRPDLKSLLLWVLKRLGISSQNTLESHRRL